MTGSDTPKNRQVVINYMTGNITKEEAAINAGFSRATAASAASRILRTAWAKQLMDEINRERMKAVQIDANWVLQQAVDIHNMDLMDICNDDGTIKPIREWPPVWRKMVSAIDVTEASSQDDLAAVVKKIRIPDKVKNLELIGKHIGVQAFSENMKINGSLTLSEKMAKARERAKK